MRKPSRQVDLNDIISGQILGDDPEVIVLVMKIHLSLEAILIEFISLKQSGDKIYRMPFPAKTEVLERLGLIQGSDREAFDRLNDFRNDFAHIFGHRVTLEDALALANDLESYGVDFSDSIGRYTAEEATVYYAGMIGVLEEVGWCILFHAGFLMFEARGRSIVA